MASADADVAKSVDRDVAKSVDRDVAKSVEADRPVTEPGSTLE